MTGMLRDAIEKASKTQKALVALTADQKTVDLKELARLRSEFQHDMFAIAKLSQEDKGLRSDDEKFTEFRSKQNAIRSELSKHQSKWMMHDIEKNRPQYESDTNTLRKSQERFFDWAIAVL